MKTRNQKRHEAADRQAAYDSLTTMQKLNKAALSRGNSSKQKTRLLAQLGKEEAAATDKARSKKAK